MNKSRVSYKQLMIMGDFFLKHPQLAKGFSQNKAGRNHSRQLWEQLALLLNSETLGPSKSATSWTAYWNDYKSKLKKKNRLYNKEAHGTGARPPSKDMEPDEVDAKFLAVLGVDFGTGLPGTSANPFPQDVSESVKGEINKDSSIMGHDPSHDHEYLKATTTASFTEPSTSTSECEGEDVDLHLYPIVAEDPLSNLQLHRKIMYKSRVSYQQLMIMGDFFLKHPQLAKGFSQNKAGRNRSQQLWEQLTMLLNSDALGPSKSAHNWTAYWNDYKSKLKKKIRLHNKEAHGTGSEPPDKGKEPDEVDAKFLAVLGADFGTDLPGTSASPFPQDDSESVKREINNDSSIMDHNQSHDHEYLKATTTASFTEPSTSTSECEGEDVDLHIQGEDRHTEVDMAEDPLSNQQPHRRNEELGSLVLCYKQFMDRAAERDARDHALNERRVAAEERRAAAEERRAAAEERRAAAEERRAAAKERRAAAEERRAAAEERRAAAEEQRVAVEERGSEERLLAS